MRLYILGQEIELKDNVISQTKQVNDIGNIETRQTNYTNTFSIPKTAKNVRTFNGLGLVGNESNVPYQKNTASLFNELGECFVFEGWALITETSNDFKCNIYDGNLELYKVIENKTLADLNLTDLNHTKTTAEVVQTFDDSKPYKYILADYNGKSLYDINKINIDYLVPSVKVSWLMEAIELYSGYTINGTFKTNPEYINLYLTYPKGLVIDSSVTRIYEYEVTALVTNDSIIQLDINTFKATKQTKITIEIDNDYEAITESGVYYVYVNATVNGVINNFKTLVLNEGDVLSVDYTESGDGYVRSGSSWISFIDKFNSTNIDFLNELKGFSIRDFLNEIVWRFGITLFKDKYQNVYNFKTLNEITNISNAIDWSSKFISQESEKYIFGCYAQNNYFRFKYNSDNASYNDGFLFIDNKNLEDQKTVIQSKTFSPELNKSMNLGFQTNVYKLWDKEIKDNSIVSYKDLNNHFYFIKSQTQAFSPSIVIGSEEFSTSQNVSSAPVDVFSGLSFGQILRENYQDINKILNKSKVLICEMNLKDSDIVDIDFSVPYFIKQLGSYYQLNKINNYVPNKLTKVELIRFDLLETQIRYNYSQEHYSPINYT